MRWHKDPTGQCNVQSLKYLIKECDMKSKDARVILEILKEQLI